MKLTPAQREEERRLKARVAFAQSEYLKARRTHGELSRTALEALCFLNGERSELQGFYSDMFTGGQR